MAAHLRGHQLVEAVQHLDAVASSKHGESVLYVSLHRIAGEPERLSDPGDMVAATA
jgi:hypothetical protein